MTKAEAEIIRKTFPQSYAEMFIRNNITLENINSLMLQRIKAFELYEQKQEEKQQKETLEKVVAEQIEKQFNKIF